MTMVLTDLSLHQAPKANLGKVLPVGDLSPRDLAKPDRDVVFVTLSRSDEALAPRLSAQERIDFKNAVSILNHAGIPVYSILPVQAVLAGMSWGAFAESSGTGLSVAFRVVKSNGEEIHPKAAKLTPEVFEAMSAARESFEEARIKVA